MAVDMDISGPLESMDNDSAGKVVHYWQVFCESTENLVHGDDIFPFEENFVSSVELLVEHGLGTLVEDHFLQVLEEIFKKIHISTFWGHFDEYLKHSITYKVESKIDDWAEEILFKALEEICMAKFSQEKCLATLKHILQSSTKSATGRVQKMAGHGINLFSRYQSMVSAIIFTTLPRHFPEVLQLYFKARLEEFTVAVENNEKERNRGDHSEDNEMETIQDRAFGLSDEMEVDDANGLERTCIEHGKVIGETWVLKVGCVVHRLRELGFTAMVEDACASSIFSLLKKKVYSLAGEDHLTSALDSIKNWIQAVPLQFLRALLPSLCVPSNEDRDPFALTSTLASCFPGKENSSERIIRWHLRLEYFAYETLGDLRMRQLFDIIIDYPESEDAIKDLKQCLENTGQHAKLVESFLSALRYRLLIPGASTSNILDQYISTVKALRTLDPTGVFLEAVGEPIGEYLRGRKDASKCIVAMLTDSTGGGNTTGDANEAASLLEELSREAINRENIEGDDDNNAEDEKAWAAAERWEPDPVEADPSVGSGNRRSIDILGILVGIFGSKEQLINEYCVILAEKLLNKSDYDIEHETRTSELFKILFGEGSMQRCEIMINDITFSKRTNANIKATLNQQNRHEGQEHSVPEGNKLSPDVVDATVISYSFWPPSQEESINVPREVNQLLDDYAKEFHTIKAPRKIVWKKNLGTVKLELQFQDRSAEFLVSPVHAAIIMHFQDQPRWTAKNLAAAVGIPVETLFRRISMWVNQGVLVESSGMNEDEHFYTIVENMGDGSRNDVNIGQVGAPFSREEEGEAPKEEELQTKNFFIYERFVKGMLTNFSTLRIEEIHKKLSDHAHGFFVYDLSLSQLERFLSRLILEDKLELNDEQYRLKKL